VPAAVKEEHMTSVKPIPDCMHTLTPGLTIKGCAEAIEFYKKALGAEERMRMLQPGGTAVWHAELKIGDSIVFVNDEFPGMGALAPSAAQPSPVHMWLYVPDCDAAFQRAVAAGGQVKMPPTDMFWGDRTGTILDPFGYAWTVATHVKDMSEDEMRRAGEEFARQMAG
jgi:PhnB protein